MMHSFLDGTEYYMYMSYRVRTAWLGARPGIWFGTETATRDQVHRAYFFMYVRCGGL